MPSPTGSDRRLFEQLCCYRALYAHRGERDRTVVMTLAETILHANRLMAEPGVTAADPGEEHRPGSTQIAADRP